MKPTFSNIIVKKTTASNTTDAGLIKTTTPAEKETAEGIIEAVGEDVTKFKKGDKILYHNYGSDIICGGIDYYLIDERNILVVLPSGDLEPKIEKNRKNK